MDMEVLVRWKHGYNEFRTHKYFRLKEEKIRFADYPFTHSQFG